LVSNDSGRNALALGLLPATQRQAPARAGLADLEGPAQGKLDSIRAAPDPVVYEDMVEIRQRDANMLAVG
jgi:hypothetical protein